MQLLLIRHGEAGEARGWAKTGRPDDERPLTDEGTDEMRAVAAGLRAAVPHIDLVASSPLTRALQTADLVADQYAGVTRVTIGELVPDQRPFAFVDWLSGHEWADVVAAVGHNPHLSELATWLLEDDELIDMKKASALLIDFPGEVGKRSGRLVWYRKRKELIALGG